MKCRVCSGPMMEVLTFYYRCPAEHYSKNTSRYGYEVFISDHLKYRIINDLPAREFHCAVSTEGNFLWQGTLKHRPTIDEIMSKLRRYAKVEIMF